MYYVCICYEFQLVWFIFLSPCITTFSLKVLAKLWITIMRIFIQKKTNYISSRMQISFYRFRISFFTLEFHFIFESTLFNLVLGEYRTTKHFLRTFRERKKWWQMISHFQEVDHVFHIELGLIFYDCSKIIYTKWEQSENISKVIWTFFCSF